MPSVQQIDTSRMVMTDESLLYTAPIGVAAIKHVIDTYHFTVHQLPTSVFLSDNIDWFTK